MRPISETGLIRYANAGHAFTHLFLMLYPTVVLALEHAWQRPYGELLSLSVVGYVLFGAGALPAGWLADRWSATGMIMVFFFGLGLASIFTGLAETPLQMAVGLSMIGLFASIYHPVGVALIVRNPARRGRTLGINGMFGGVGTASAALIAGVLIDLYSWRAAFFVPGALSLLAGLGFWIMVRGRELHDFSASDRGHEGHGSATVLRTVGLLFAITLCTGIIYQALSVSLPKVLVLRTQVFGETSMTDVGGKVTLIFLAAGAVQVAGGYLADRYPQKLLLLLGYVVMVPTMLAAATLFGLPLLLAMMVIVSINVGMLPVTDSILTSVTPPDWRATIFGAKFVLALGVAASGVPMVAYIFDTTGDFNLLFMLMAGFAAVVLLVGLGLPGRPRQVRVPLAEPATETGAGAS